MNNTNRADKEKKVAAVVVTYNRKDLLKECLDALLNQDYKNCEIIVVDNASTDGTADMISTDYSGSVDYYNTGENIGGAGGFNYGIKKAYGHNCDYIWLMDDDCAVKADSLSVLIKEAEKLNDEFGFLSSRVLWKDGSLCRMNIPKKSYTKNVGNEESGITPVMMATFVSFFVRSRVVEEVGLPIKDFFIWADDLEYSRRISKKHPCYYVFDSAVIHNCKSNLGSNLARDDRKDLQRYSYAYRNEYYIYQREGFAGKLYYWIRRNHHRARIILYGDRKKEKLSIINNALKEAKHFSPKIEFVDKIQQVQNQGF